MSHNKIFIYASDLAIITRHNKYKPVSEIMIKLYQKHFPEDYKFTRKLISDKNLNLTIQEKPNEILNRISKQNNIAIDNDLNKCLASNNVDQLKQNQQQLLDKFSQLNQEQKKELNESLNNLTNTNFGTIHENSALKIYESQKNQKVYTTDKFFKKALFKTSLNEWYIGGKIDGITEDKIIIEIKNRVNKLFHSVRDYEKVQAYAYMKILDLDKVDLLECLKTNRSESNIIRINFDQNYYQSQISNKIISFIKLFEKILKNQQLKIKLLTEDKNKLESFINKNL